MRGFILIAIFGPEREGVTAEELWRQLSILNRNKVETDEKPTIMRLRETLETLKADGMVRTEGEGEETIWLPVHSREKQREMAPRETQAAMF